MRDVDERIAAVQGRVTRMRRKRNRTAAGALATLTVLAFAGLMGIPIAGGFPTVIGQSTTAPDGPTLFGASSLFGPSVGGYVLVALVTAVVVALITALCVNRRRSGKEDTNVPEAPIARPDEADSHKR